MQLSVGGAGTGSPPHFHKAAANMLVYGRKRWLLFPPQDALYQKQPIAEWLAAGNLEQHRAEGRAVLECEQQAGDMMWIPDYWGHAVYNLDTSVGIAIEGRVAIVDYGLAAQAPHAAAG